MSHYHIIIQQERRTEPERMALPISAAVATGKIVNEMPEYVAGPAQLHSFTGANLYKTIGEGEDAAQVLDFSDPQFVMVAEWDLQAPYVICHKGDYAARNLHFGGWPEMIKEQFDALATDTPAA